MDSVDEEQMLAARAKLAQRFGESTRTGGKGTARRKKKAVRKGHAKEDKQLRSVLKRQGATAMPSIEEVNMFQEDGNILHFQNPKVEANVKNNLYAVFGNPEVKSVTELMPEIIPQLPASHIQFLKQYAEQAEQQDEEIPDLVENFDDFAEHEEYKDEEELIQTAAITDAIETGQFEKLIDMGIDIPQQHAVDLKFISDNLKDNGMKLELTNDPEKSDLQNGNLLTKKFETTVKLKIHEDFSNYTANPHKYREDFKNSVAQFHGVSPEDIIIRSVKPGSVDIDYIVKTFNNENEKLNRVYPDGTYEEEISKQIGKPLKAELLKSEKTFKLAASDFNPSEDREYTGQNLKNWAGKRDYIQPPIGWTGKALQVGARNQSWIGTGDQAWPIVYHGIGGKLEEVVPKVVKTGLRPGWVNAVSPGAAIYCTQHFDYARKYSCKGKSDTISTLEVIMQCRVNPEALVTKVDEYRWYVEDSKDIRPYRMIIPK